MDELAIKIKICDRVYPIKVQAADEERIRAAGKLINDQVKTYRTKFGIHDKQDLLAMVAFDCLTNTLQLHSGAEGTTQIITERVDALVELIDQVLI